jgi:DNA-binding transcriptional ArsR family regulator
LDSTPGKKERYQKISALNTVAGDDSYGVDMSVYSEALIDKNLAAKILLPLIEFEFCFMGDDSPTLVQAQSNAEQLKAVFEICKAHGWTDNEKPLTKRSNLYFRLTKKGLMEIHDKAGRFASESKNAWTTLILERAGKIGGYRVGTEKTQTRVERLLKQERNWWTVEQLCLDLRLTPSTVREAIRLLNKQNLVLKKKLGKTTYWRIS